MTNVRLMYDVINSKQPTFINYPSNDTPSNAEYLKCRDSENSFVIRELWPFLINNPS